MNFASVASATLLTGTTAFAAAPIEGFRPPAVPLVVNDPYLSIWSRGDKLTDITTKHWTGANQTLVSLIRIDGKSYRLMGDAPADLPALTQTKVVVLPLRTIYSFEDAGVNVTLTFLTPMLPDNLEALSRPVTYVEWSARSTDGAAHEAQIFLSASGQVVVNNDRTKVQAEVVKAGELSAAKIGAVEQNPLATRGDQIRIDWGRAYVATAAKGSNVAVGPLDTLVASFNDGGKLAKSTDKTDAVAASDGTPSVAVSLDFGKLSDTAASQVAMVAMDDGASAINYFGTTLPAYWQHKGSKFDDMLGTAAKEYPKLLEASKKFDEELMADLSRVGGDKYATLAALAYRQSIAGGKLVADTNGKPLYFSKENSSNGCMATVDITYPQSPIFLLFSPALVKASLVPVLEYSSSGRWPWPYAPHDLGTYPQALGQVYGGGERNEDGQMPVEESGNILIILAALARIEGNAKFAEEYWPTITKWAQYLEKKGFDPENQLCTDDFAGHLAHNTNLSIKAIQALAGYGVLCDLRGDKQSARKYNKLAKDMAERWVKEADDGDHFRLAFDQQGTWSQKYNLVWDRLLDFNVFPPEVAQKELNFYTTQKLNQYGLPLDNRRAYAKTDWTVWTATMATDPAQFAAIIDPLYAFFNDSESRVPFSDWYRTNETKIEGFIARPVIGGVFMKMLGDKETWKKYADRPAKIDNDWPALPKPPKITTVLKTAREEKVDWSYTFDKPGDDWFAPKTDVSKWKTGKAGFGSRGTPGAEIGTVWRGDDIWIRREFTLKAGDPIKDLQLYLHHDEDAEVYLNGVLSTKVSGFVGDYSPRKISDAARATLKPGKNVIAIHCRQETGGQFIDAGLVTVTPVK